MPPTMKELGIDQLSPADRVELALEIWESLDPPPLKTNLTSEQRAELARRDAELEAHPELAITWNELRSGIEAGK